MALQERQSGAGSEGHGVLVRIGAGTASGARDDATGGQVKLAVENTGVGVRRRRHAKGSMWKTSSLAYQPFV
jgi:hypothetical protein